MRPEVVQLELFTHRFAAVAWQMGERLRRTAVSTNVKERLDFSCALLDAAGELVVNAPHIPAATPAEPGELPWMGEDPGHGVVEAGLLRPPVFKRDDCQVDLTVARAGKGRPERGLHPGSGFLIRQVRAARLEPVR
ncbi:MAG TPA: hydantoinase B/oxoprolinase family protein [Thermoanaerobaculia bacterium]|nr:hydantoinase B/oxoprolinase family protein [Thermoanaerobaculia bacterium]